MGPDAPKGDPERSPLDYSHPAVTLVRFQGQGPAGRPVTSIEPLTTTSSLSQTVVAFLPFLNLLSAPILPGSEVQ